MAIKAIFVGINKHLDTTIPELSGARRDAAALCAQFADNGDGMRVRLPVDDTFSRVKSVAFDRPKWPEEWLWTRLSQLTVAFLRFRSSCWSKCLTRKGLPWRSACSEDLGPRLIDTSFIECRHIPALHATIGGSASSTILERGGIDGLPMGEWHSSPPPTGDYYGCHATPSPKPNTAYCSSNCGCAFPSSPNPKYRPPSRANTPARQCPCSEDLRPRAK